jgi:anti-sigma factor RsiW
MHHPSEDDLALYAGNDLGRLARLRVNWHLRKCGKCQQEVTEFSALRLDTSRNAPEPQVNWDRLALEMKANIRVGLQAGECVGPVRRNRAQPSWSWAMAATAAILAVGALGEFWIHHGVAGKGLEADARLPQMAAVLRNNSRGSVVYSVNAQGGVGASYVDRDTGMVTVNNIYYGQ